MPLAGSPARGLSGFFQAEIFPEHLIKTAAAAPGPRGRAGTDRSGCERKFFVGTP